MNIKFKNGSEIKIIETKGEDKRGKSIPIIERIYEDNDWTIDKIGDTFRISLFEDFHFVNELFLTKENFLKFTKDN